MDIVTETAVAIYQQAGESPEAPPKRGAEVLVRKIHGPRSIWTVPHSQAEGAVVTLEARRQLMVREGMTPARRNFVLAKLLARARLEVDSGFAAMSEPDRARLENEIAAWVCAPPRVFASAARNNDRNLRQLSFAFNMTETACALRIGEIDPDRGAAVTTPIVVHRKGRRFAWESDETIRELAARRNPKSVVKRRIFDEPGRTALLPRSA